MKNKIKSDIEKYTNNYKQIVDTLHEKQDLVAATEQEINQLTVQANQLQGAIYGLQELLTEESDDTINTEVSEE